jgi:hypothetical protein
MLIYGFGGDTQSLGEAHVDDQPAPAAKPPFHIERAQGRRSVLSGCEQIEHSGGKTNCNGEGTMPFSAALIFDGIVKSLHVVIPDLIRIP